MKDTKKKMVKPPTVNNFFYFFNLITGNLVVGWAHFVLGIIMILIFFYFLIFNSGTKLEVENIEVEVHEESHDEFTDTFDISEFFVCGIFKKKVLLSFFWNFSKSCH